jgi:predicted amidophosphoribosyltransferase
VTYEETAALTECPLCHKAYAEQRAKNFCPFCGNQLTDPIVIDGNTFNPVPPQELPADSRLKPLVTVPEGL